MAQELKEFLVEEFDAKNFKSMFIEASAGTGKTYTIENLVKALVEAGQPLEKTLIVTYTEKAVGELKHRIREKLSKLESRVDVDNAPIFTIHSFCQRTLEEFSFTARKPYSLRLIDNGEMQGFVDQWIRDELKDDCDFQTLYSEAEKKQSFVDALKNDFIAAANRYYLDMNGAENKNVVELDDIAIVKKATKTFSESLFTFNDCDALLEGGPDAENYKKAFSRAGTKDNVKKIKAYKTIRFYKSKLSSLYIAWQKEKEARKEQTFNDMIRNVREAVCEKDSRLAKQLRQKYSIAIIDEFQDTNQEQWDIFRTVFMEGSAKEKAEHKIIVVGDPKQSIYAFQGADVNVYNNATREIKKNGGGAYGLKTNYRSSTSMIEACNRLFMQKTDAGEEINFFTEQEFEASKAPEKKEQKILPAEFGGSETPPFWIFGNAEIPKKPEEFAEFAVKKIIDCCAKDKDGKSALQIFDKNESKRKKLPVMRSVSFCDFAVLARTRSEMELIEAELKKYGVPFYRYKDTNLFYGLECASWVSLLNAICAGDFNGSNRARLSEALWTKFFGVELERIGDQSFDNPSNAARQKILLWRQIAQKRQWAKLVEAIFEDSQIENLLANSQSLQSVSKFRQIGNYIAEYLYSKDCSLEEAAKHLQRLSNSSEDLEEGQNLVAKGSNFDSVQIMTIYAAKGLEFPVVLAACGFKKKNNNGPSVYLYHDKREGRKAKLSFSEYGKEMADKESSVEWQRIYYVAYTRASSLMILPYYDAWNEVRKDKTALNLLGRNFGVFLDNPENKKFYKMFGCPKNDSEKAREEMSEDKYKESVKKILGSFSEGKKNSDNVSSKDQLKNARELASKVLTLGVQKHSYSTLSQKNKDDAPLDQNLERLNKEEEIKVRQSLAFFDAGAKALFCKENLLENLAPPESVSSRYPRGSFLGSALHEVLEKIDFNKAASQDIKEFCADSAASALIDRCFARQGLSIDSEDSLKWREQSACFVWNTLNARLPEICGAKETGADFSLKDISFYNRLSEARFEMLSEFASGKKGALENFCNGAIDLIFKRRVGAKEVYSILDWKSNRFDLEKERADGLSGGEDLVKKITDDEYSIQRVLYSYCLIVWLRQFYGGDEEEIFNERFGGIYYVYLRYCKKDSRQGIYAQTWKSWSDLKSAFKNICQKLIVQGK